LHHFYLKGKVIGKQEHKVSWAYHLGVLINIPDIGQYLGMSQILKGQVTMGPLHLPPAVQQQELTTITT